MPDLTNTTVWISSSYSSASTRRMPFTMFVRSDSDICFSISWISTTRSPVSLSIENAAPHPCLKPGWACSTVHSKS